MKTLPILATLLLATPAAAHNLTPGSEQAEAVLLQGGTLNTVTQGRLEDTDLLFKDGKIEAMGANLEVPEGARVIDISGHQVYPGLIALDTTLGLVEMSAVRATVDTTEVGSVTPEVSAHHAFNADSEIIPTIRYNGITHAQAVPQGNLVRGNSSLMKLDSWNYRDGLEQADVGMHVSWPRVGLNTSPWERRSPEEQRRANAQQLEELKEAFTTARAYYNAREAGRQPKQDVRWEGMAGLFDGSKKLFVHADDRRQMTQAIDFAKEQGMPLTLVGARDAWMIAEQLAAEEVSVIFGDPYGIPARTDDAYDTAFTTPKKLAEAGVDFAIAYPGFWDTRNLAFAAGHAVAFGLDYDQALYAITMAPARMMGAEDKLGSLEVGKQASLVVSAGDILDPLGQSIEFMFIDGRLVDLSNRQRQLYEKYKQR
ncbi:amidohydrolase [Aliidiomarina minuta]|uniref:Amidohydrolase n=1 Tax=Aliidiomarina minuta TaxID=880057 RepID=A0A432W7S1_9GAMM|nr:amidohydrolase family protein [Aliidiomarina minuta]RUO26105.1 amidohydrolase [Aliidiomarina minuta]